MSFTTTCAQCRSDFDASRSDARFCGSACRGAHWRSSREAEAEQGRLGAELLARLTRAVIDGAPEAELDAILDEAQRVLPQ